MRIKNDRRSVGSTVRAVLLSTLLVFCDLITAQTIPEFPAMRAQSDIITTPDGLRVVAFTVPQGRIIINLPDDIRAGEMISGTVLAEPTGDTNEERIKNLADLHRYVFDLSGTKITPSRSMFTWTPQSRTVSKYVLQIVEAPGRAAPAEMSGAATLITLDTSTTGPASDIAIPAVGQAGRNMVVTGPFDGNGANTIVSIPPSTASAQPATLFLIAESPRKAVLRCPTTVTGPIQLTVNEGGKTKTGSFRNIGILLSAPKTSLSRGEQATVTIEIVGLQGITAAVSVSLKTIGAIAIAGGNDQKFTIDPREVPAAGTYTTTRNIMGVQAGGFNVNASIIMDGKP